MKHVVTAERLFDGCVMHGPSSVTISNGIVTDISSFDGHPDHHIICPGFVDLQMNGYDDVDCGDADSDALLELDAALAHAGTMSYLSTLVTADLGDMTQRIDRIRRTAAPGCMGLHLEGPFLGSAPGAHSRSLVVPPDMEWLCNIPREVRMVTVGIEHELSCRAITELVGRGVLVSVGHTRPTCEQWDAAINAGATMVTHLFNAMSGIHHRDFGIALAAIMDERVITGLIADLRHVQRDAVSLAFRAKPGGVCLVSDSIAWRSRWAARAGVILRDGVPTLADGTLAGSATPLGLCVKRAVIECGVDPAVALTAATSLPASLIGRSDLGTISAQTSCDIVALDDSLDVAGTWRRLQSPRAFQTHT